MPSYSGNYNPTVGPIIQVTILKLDPITQQPLQADGKNLSLFNALIDTGATSTCILPHVAAKVGLDPIGKAPMIGATGSKAVNQFMFGVGFVSLQNQDPNGFVQAGIQVVGTTGMEFTIPETNFEVLLGRDVICKGVFNLSFDGHYVFSI